MRQILLTLITCLLIPAVSGQVKSSIDDKGVYQNPQIGFSFTVPSGLRDVTAKANETADKDPDAVQLVLFELSGPDDNDLDWRGLAIQTYPRSKVSTASDAEAELRLSRTVTGNMSLSEQPSKIAVNGLTFAVSKFQKEHGMLTQHSWVYATVMHGQIIGFVFTGNSTSQLESMAESLKTLKVNKTAK